jgi:hypothetical protein
MTNIEGDQVTAKRQKIVENIKNSPMKIIAEQSMSSQTPLGSAMELDRRS